MEVERTGRTVWLVKKNVWVTMVQAWSHGTSSSSTSMRINSTMASVGWVYTISQPSVSILTSKNKGTGVYIVQLNSIV